MTSKRLLSWLGVFAAILAFSAGCSQEEAKPSAPAAEIVSFLASPAAIEAGQTTRLSWQTRLASRVQVVEVGGAAIDLGDAPVSAGSVEITPGATTTYALRAFNDDDKSVEKTVEVQVTPAPAAPVIASFTATPGDVGLGGDVTFAWTTENADSVAIVDAAGRSVNLHGAAAAQGQAVIQARSTTTYTLTAKGIGGEATATAQVNVSGTPRVTLTVPGAPVAPGDEATVAWTSENAASIRVSDENGNIVYQGSDRPNGSVIVQPDFTTRYVVEATGGTGSGNASASGSVQVRPVVDRFVVTTEGPVHAGDQVDLAWSVRGARSLVVGRLGAQSLTVSPENIPSGTARMIAGTDGVFRIAARSGGILTESVASVPVSLAPKVRDVAISPPVVSASVDYPANVVVSWMIDGAARVELEAIPGGDIPVNGYSPRADSVMVSITETTTFRVRGYNDSGVGIGESTVIAYLAPNVNSFRVLPSTAEVGETVHLSWDTSEAERIVIEKNGVPLAIQQDLVDGTFSDQVFVDSTYVLRTWNPANFEVDSLPVDIHVGSPAVVSFAANVALGHINQPLTFNWQNDGGQALAITDETGATVCSNTDLIQIAAGSCTITAPATAGHHVYTLHLTSGLGNETTAVYELDLTDGPIVRSLTADRTLLTTGETIVVSWAVEDDATGNDPVLVLTDDIGNSYDLGGAAANAGSATITPLGSGLRTLTLAASAGSTTGHTTTLGLDIRRVPAITLFAANPEIVDTANGSIPASSNLHWTSTDGYSLAIYALDTNGNRMMPAVHTSAVQAEALNGTFAAAPTPGTNEFELEVNNGAGTVDTAVVTVYVDPAEILSFNAAPTEILAGEPVTLNWTTNRATAVKLMPPNLAELNVVALGNTFVNINSSPTKRILDNTTTYDALVTLNFPSNFTFPFDGVNRTSIKVSGDGFLSFGSPSATAYNNVALPSSANSSIHMMPFWDQLARNTSGSMLWDDGVDAEGRYVIIQWTDFRVYATTSSLNFQVVLRENGNFEYRYGTMSGSGYTAQVNGSSATIGAQNTAGTAAQQVSYNTQIMAGLSNTGYRFESAVLPVNQTGIDKYPGSNTTYTLIASNAHSEDRATQSVIVHQPVSVTATAPTTDLVVGTAFPISWTASNATAIEVLDDNGQVIYNAAATELASGTYNRVEPVAGQHTYAVRAHGTLGRDVQTATVTRPVYAAPLTLTSFTASPSVVGPGNPVALTWAGSGAATVEITANGTPISTAGKNPNGDTLNDVPTVNTTYVLTLRDAPTGGIAQRSRSLTRSVTVSSTRIAASATPAQLPPGGGTVNVSWTSTDADYVYMPGVIATSDVSATAPFTDIRSSGTQAIAINGGDGPTATITFPSNFTFKFDGVARTSIKVWSDGWGTFDTGQSADYSNVRLPTTGKLAPMLAPFWDDLHTGYSTSTTPPMPGTGTVHWALVTPTSGPRQLVIQWTAMQFYSSPITAAPNSSSLNFEIVLFEDGAWEYRYGSMTAATQARADGSDATIGWQFANGTTGTSWSYNTAVSGGLSNKSIRFNPNLPANGNTNVNVTTSGTVQVCAYSTSYTPCQDVQVVVVQPGDITIGEIMAKPVTNPDGEWFEVRNTRSYPIDINGWVIGSGTADTSHTISNGGPLVIPPSGFVTFARTGSGLGFTPSYVYGTGLTLDETAADEISLTYATTQIDKVAWTATWWTSLAAGTSLSLDPSYYSGVVTKNDAQAAWCVPTAGFGSGNFGSPGAVGVGCRDATYDLDAASTMPFIDISTTGTDITGLNADSGYQASGAGTAIGFNMQWFGDTVTTLYGSSNGFLAFVPLTATTSSGASAMPSASTPNGVIAPFWDDLTSQTGSSVKTELRTVGGTQVRIVQWTNMLRYSYPGSVTFQVQLWQTGDVVMAYKNASAASSSNQLYYDAGDATIGIENNAGTAGILVNYNTRMPLTNRSMLIHRKVP